MPANGAAIREEAFPPPGDAVVDTPFVGRGPHLGGADLRAALYDGLVGEGTNHVAAEQQRLAAAMARAEPADLVHHVSVAAGYAALAAGCAATAVGLTVLF